jgi:hypothetical protein
LVPGSDGRCCRAVGESRWPRGRGLPFGPGIGWGSPRPTMCAGNKRASPRIGVCAPDRRRQPARGDPHHRVRLSVGRAAPCRDTARAGRRHPQRHSAHRGAPDGAVRARRPPADAPGSKLPMPGLQPQRRRGVTMTLVAHRPSREWSAGPGGFHFQRLCSGWTGRGVRSKGERPLIGRSDNRNRHPAEGRRACASHYRLGLTAGRACQPCC